MSEAEARYASLKNEFGGISDQLVRRVTASSMRERLIKLEAGPLPTDMAADLAQLAASFSDLLTFEESGTVRFNSDFTFSSGSDVLKEKPPKPSARWLIQNAARLGLRVQSSATPTTSRSNPATRAKHKNNTYRRPPCHFGSHGLGGCWREPAHIKVWAMASRPVVANTRKGRLKTVG